MRYLLIPACEVKKKNSLAGTTTKKRLKKGVVLWKKGVYDAIIVTGGIYLPPQIQTIPSGNLMKEWLREKGISSESIICENRSRDTYENIQGTLSLIAEDRDPQLTVVTHWQHALRFWVTFRLAFGVKICIKPMYYRIGWKNFLLEWPMLFCHLVDKKGTGFIARSNREKRSRI